MSPRLQVLALALLLLTLLVWMLAGCPGRRAEEDRVRPCQLRPPAVIVRPSCDEPDDREDDVRVRVPDVYQLLPHLLQSRGSLRPIVLLGDGLVGDPTRRGSRSSISLAIGVVIGSRGGERAVDFLEHLVDRITADERDQTLIVVLLELEDIVGYEAMRDRFGAEVESGLIEVICAPDSFYPSYIDGDGDKGNWKHVLDVSFLMMYSQERAEFYLQLTDESHVSRGFVTKMQWFAMELEAKQYWMAIKYSEQGFAGNLFLSSELPRTIQFFLMFYNDQKIEDLFKNLVYAKACRPGMIQAECQSRMNKIWVKHKVPLIRVGSATRSRNNSDVAAVLVV